MGSAPSAATYSPTGCGMRKPEGEDDEGRGAADEQPLELLPSVAARRSPAHRDGGECEGDRGDGQQRDGAEHRRRRRDRESHRVREVAHDERHVLEVVGQQCPVHGLRRERHDREREGGPPSARRQEAIGKQQRKQRCRGDVRGRPQPGPEPERELVERHRTEQRILAAHERQRLAQPDRPEHEGNPRNPRTSREHRPDPAVRECPERREQPERRLDPAARGDVHHVQHGADHAGTDRQHAHQEAHAAHPPPASVPVSRDRMSRLRSGLGAHVQRTRARPQ